jgi:signal transduction histidine kinase
MTSDLDEQATYSAKRRLEKQIVRFMQENLDSIDSKHPLDLVDSPSPDSGVPTRLYRAIRLLAFRDTLGPKLSSAALYLSGRTIAKRMGIQSASDMIDAFEEFGIRDASVDRSEGDSFSVSVGECPTCSGLPNLGESVCHFESGLISGGLEGTLGTQYDVIETRCWGLGDRICTWEGRPSANRDLRDFRPDELEARDDERARSDRLREDLTDMLVHDMRVPLNTIIGSVQTLEEMANSKLDGKEKDLLHMAISGGFALLRMTSELLDISRLEKCELALTTICCRIDRPISEAVAQVEFGTTKKGLQLSVDIPSDLPPVRMDCDRLVRVLINLLQNAIRHTPTGGRVELTAAMDASKRAIVLTVSDSGEGIAKEYHSRIFEKFVQVESYRNNSRFSCGLGLAYCKLIVEAHGGRIYMNSEPGEGSAFTFTIPIDPLSDSSSVNR